MPFPTTRTLWLPASGRGAARTAGSPLGSKVSGPTLPTALPAVGLPPPGRPLRPGPAAPEPPACPWGPALVLGVSGGFAYRAPAVGGLQVKVIPTLRAPALALAPALLALASGL